MQIVERFLLICGNVCMTDKKNLQLNPVSIYTKLWTVSDLFFNYSIELISLNMTGINNFQSYLRIISVQ